MTHQTVMSTSDAAAGSNSTAVSSIAQKLVCNGNIKILVIKDKNINQKINQH